MDEFDKYREPAQINRNTEDNGSPLFPIVIIAGIAVVLSFLQWVYNLF